jgi:ribosomal protein L35
MAKLKQKTHKGTSKVLNVRKSGTVTMGRPGSRHNTGKKNRDINRKNRKGSVLSNSDKRRLKTVIYN